MGLQVQIFYGFWTDTRSVQWCTAIQRFSKKLKPSVSTSSRTYFCRGCKLCVCHHWIFSTDKYQNDFLTFTNSERPSKCNNRHKKGRTGTKAPRAHYWFLAYCFYLLRSKFSKVIFWTLFCTSPDFLISFHLFSPIQNGWIHFFRTCDPSSNSLSSIILLQFIKHDYLQSLSDVTVGMVLRYTEALIYLSSVVLCKKSAYLLWSHFYEHSRHCKFLRLWRLYTQYRTLQLIFFLDF